MNPSTESDRQHGRAEPGHASTAQHSRTKTDAAKEWEERKRNPVHRQGNGHEPTITEKVYGFIEQNPVVAAAGALAVGAAVAMVWRSRSNYNYNRFDRRAARAARSMEKTFNREMRALRHSDMADRLGRFGSSIGDMLGRVDLAPLAERGKTYLDAARSRFNV